MADDPDRTHRDQALRQPRSRALRPLRHQAAQPGLGAAAGAFRHRAVRELPDQHGQGGRRLQQEGDPGPRRPASACCTPPSARPSSPRTATACPTPCRCPGPRWPRRCPAASCPTARRTDHGQTRCDLRRHAASSPTRRSRCCRPALPGADRAVRDAPDQGRHRPDALARAWTCWRARTGAGKSSTGSTWSTPTRRRWRSRSGRSRAICHATGKLQVAGQRGAAPHADADRTSKVQPNGYNDARATSRASAASQPPASAAATAALQPRAQHPPPARPAPWKRALEPRDGSAVADRVWRH